MPKHFPPYGLKLLFAVVLLLTSVLESSSQSVTVLTPFTTYPGVLYGTVVRTFDIQINGNTPPINDLTITYTQETEVGSSTFEFWYNGSMFSTMPGAVTMLVDVSGLSLPDDAVITVIETVIVDSCNNPDQTQYHIQLGCTCTPFTYSSQLSVVEDNLTAMAFGPISFPTIACPADSFDVSFRMTNPNNNVNFIDGAAIKYVHTISFPFNSALIDDAIATLRIGNYEIPFSSIGTSPTDFVSLGSGLGWNTLTINFDNYLTPDPSLLPLVLTPDGWMIGETQQIDLQFHNLRFFCNFASQVDVGNCLSLFLVPGSDSPMNVAWRRMCGTPVTQYYSIGFQNFSGSSCPSNANGFIEADETDAEIGDTIGISYCNYTNHNPWYFQQYWTGGSPLFTCPMGDTVTAVIELTAHYTLADLQILYTPPGSTTIDTILVDSTAFDSISKRYYVDGLRYGCCLSFSVVLDSCVYGDFGYDDIGIYFESRCSRDCDCGIAFGGASVPIYRHCQGPCSKPVGTDNNSFRFDRKTMGWTDNTMATHVTDGLENRVYLCDEIESECAGGVFICPVCDSTCSVCTQPSLVYLELHFEDGDASALAYQLDLSQSKFIIDSPGYEEIDILPSNVTYTYTGINIRIENEDLGGGDNIYDHYFSPGAVNHILFEGVFIVTQTAPLMTASIGFYQFPQVRAQFRAVIGGSDWESCDSWGDNMNILTPETSTTINFNAGCTACTEMLIIDTSVSGGLPNSDDFPNEFRPVTMWPDTIVLDSLDGLHFHHGAYSYRKPNNTLSSWIDVCGSQSGSVATITGLLANPFYLNSSQLCLGTRSTVPETEVFTDCNGWMVLDKHNNCLQQLRLFFDQDCALYSSADVLFPAILNESCGNQFGSPLDKNTATNITESIAFTFTGSSLVNAYTNPVEIGATMRYLSNTHPSAANFWLYMEDNSVAPGSVTLESVLVNGFPVPTAGGFFHLEDYTSANPSIWLTNVFKNVKFNFGYTCQDGPPYPLNEVTLYYGYNCGGYPTSLDSLSCLVDTIHLRIQPQPAEIDLSVINPDDTYSACDTIPYVATLTNNEEADVFNPSFSFVLPAGMALLVNATEPHCQYGTNPNIPLGAPTGFTPPDIYSWDLGSLPVILDDVDNVLPGLYTTNGTPFEFDIYLQFTSECNTSGPQEFSFDVDGDNPCLDSIPDVEELFHTVDIIPAGGDFSLSVDYPSPFNCDSENEVVITLDEIEYLGSATADVCVILPDSLDISGSVPPVSSTSIPTPGFTEYCWSISAPGALEIITYEIVVNTPFCDTIDITTNATVNHPSCSNPCSLQDTQSLNICCTECSAEFSITQVDNCCYFFGDTSPGAFPCNDGGWGIFRADGSWVATYQGVSSFQHCFTENGEYLVCNTVCCGDGNHDKICHSIFVEGCGCSAEFEISQLDACCYKFTDTTPGAFPCNDGGWGIFRADGSWVATYQGVSSFQHCFTENGEYLVCNTVCCGDGNHDKICHSIFVEGCGCNAQFHVDQVDKCCYKFTDTSPGFFPCENGGWGIFKADGTWVATYQGVSSFQHCFTEDGEYLVCQTVCCEHSEMDKSCQTIYVAGCGCSADFTVTKVNNCCYKFTDTAPDIFPCNKGGWGIFKADGSLVATYQGVSSFEHCFTENGEYLVCNTVCCEKGEKKKSCQTIYVEGCGCSPDFIAIEAGNCCYYFEASTIGLEPCDKDGWVIKDSKDKEIATYGGILSFTFCFPEAGEYKICHIVCCEGGNAVEFCKNVTIIGDCCTADAAFSIDKNDNCCYTFKDNTIEKGMDCWKWIIEDPKGDEVASGNQEYITYCFEPGFTYTVCLTDCCKDKEGNIHEVQHCEEIFCDCCWLEDYTVMGCDSEGMICIDPKWANDCEAPTSLLVDYGDGGGMISDLCHAYTSNGTYTICVYEYCGDSEIQLVECKEISVNCTDESSCTTLTNSGTINNPKNDRGRGIADTPDGGYIVVGTINEKYTGNGCTGAGQACDTNESDIYVAKFDATGVKQWDNQFGESASGTGTVRYHESGVGVVVKGDHYYVLGEILVDVSDDVDLYVIKIDASGNEIWGKRYGYSGNSREYASQIIDASSGSTEAMLVVGSTNKTSPAATNLDAFAMKIGADGTVLASKAYWQNNSSSNDASSNTRTEYARDVVKINLSGTDYFVINGESNTIATTPDKRVFAFRIDQSLVPQQGLVIDNANSTEQGWCVETDGTYIYLANSITTASGEDMQVVQLNASNLSYVSDRVYTNASKGETPRDLTWMNNNILVLVGQNSGTEESDGLLLQIDPTQSLSATASHITARSGYDERYFAITRNYVATGYWDNNAFTTTVNDEDRDLYITQVNTDLSSCCSTPWTTGIASAFTSGSGLGSRSISLQKLDHGYPAGEYSLHQICPEQGEPRSSEMEAIEPIDHAKLVTLVPNPGNGVFRINTLDVSLVYSIDIFDLSGKLVYSYQCNECTSSVEISLPGIQQGMYIANVKTTSGQAKLKCLIQY